MVFASLTPGRAIALWMASPEHRANLLSYQWHEIGVAAVHENDAPGVYHGLPVTIVTTDFGARRSVDTGYRGGRGRSRPS